MNFEQNSPGVGEAEGRAEPSGGTSPRFDRARGQSLSSLFSKSLVVDLIERAFVLIFFLYFAHRMLPGLAGLIAVEIANPRLLWLAGITSLEVALLVISELFGVLLILMRRSTTLVSTHPLDWALAFVAVNAPLLAAPAAQSTFMPSQIPTALMFSGLIIQISAKAILCRGYGVVPANRGIKTEGPYGVVRHPIYAGYTLTHIGFLLGFPSVQNALIYLAAFSIEVARLLREESFLNKDPLYRTYAARVHYRLLPGVF